MKRALYYSIIFFANKKTNQKYKQSVEHATKMPCSILAGRKRLILRQVNWKIRGALVALVTIDWWMYHTRQEATFKNHFWLVLQTLGQISTYVFFRHKPQCGQNRLTRFHADHDLPWALLMPENWAYFIKATYRRSQFWDKLVCFTKNACKWIRKK